MFFVPLKYLHLCTHGIEQHPLFLVYSINMKSLWLLDVAVHFYNIIVSTPQNLPFKRIKHIITEQDFQPTIDSCILIMVFGQLQVSY